ncbi:MAG TPA: 23S rRNA (adenine(2503)-C(2))-methyltransferase RlmN [bacterium]|jgi:23S rRNA (adenine2503-C2)-methyltransferase|nr:23S rRNA (adenine(2503)-C(2))-methyltransferase RlmN [bacterium]
MTPSPSIDLKKDLLGLSKASLIEELGRLGEKPFRAGQIFEWVYKHGATDFSGMHNLGKALRERLCADYRLSSLGAYRVQRSQRDGTAKYLFQCADGQLVESVFLPHEGRNTACLSTQVGCAMGCTFCATGESGFARNLSPGEIVAQVRAMEADQGAELHNLVLMGMGEPLHNWGNVREAMSALLDPAGRQWGPRHITLSTCGIASGIDALRESGLKLRLAISLHAPEDGLRATIMPINRRYPLKELMRSVRDYQAATDLQVTFEYTLFKGLNDSTDQAHAVADLLKGVDSKVNLIPYNTVQGLDFRAPDFDTVVAFQSVLKKRGLIAMVRTEKGGDIDAACGQLRRRAA